MTERWVDIQGTSGSYQISDLGRLKSISKQWICGTKSVRSKPETIMVWNQDLAGYSITTLRINGKPKAISLHRMIAIHFIDNPLNKPYVNHVDGNKRNNSIDNLEWCTASENAIHAFSIGLNSSPKGEGSHNGVKVKITKKNTGEVFIFPTMSIAAKEMGIGINTISQNLNNHCKSHNYIFEYA